MNIEDRYTPGTTRISLALSKNAEKPEPVIRPDEYFDMLADAARVERETREDKP